MQNPRGRLGASWCLELTDALNLCMLSEAIVPFLYNFIKLEELQANCIDIKTSGLSILDSEISKLVLKQSILIKFWILVTGFYI